MATVAQKVWFARSALTLLKWEWFAGAGIGRNRDERKLIPPLLFNLYLAHKAGKKLSKREACKLMHVDSSRTGQKYIAYLADLHLIVIEDQSPVDRRKHFVVPTKELLTLVEAELLRAVKLAITITPLNERRRVRRAPR
jgi:hypothetical protein